MALPAWESDGMACKGSGGKCEKWQCWTANCSLRFAPHPRFGPDGNISTTTGSTAVNVGTDVAAAHRMHQNDPLTLLLLVRLMFGILSQIPRQILTHLCPRQINGIDSAPLFFFLFFSLIPSSAGQDWNLSSTCPSASVSVSNSILFRGKSHRLSLKVHNLLWSLLYYLTPLLRAFRGTRLSRASWFVQDLVWQLPQTSASDGRITFVWCISSLADD